jgi:hypothetical protein
MERIWMRGDYGWRQATAVVSIREGTAATLVPSDEEV